LLSVELKIPKSSLSAKCLELGIAAFVKSQILDRNECEQILAQAAKTREKALAGPLRGKVKRPTIEYVAEEAAE
jgi:predicted oxidoreductase